MSFWTFTLRLWTAYSAKMDDRGLGEKTVLRPPSQYDSYDLTLDGQEELDDNRKIEIDFGESATLCAFTVKQKLVSDNRECEAAVSSTRGQYYLRASTDIDCYVYATHGQTGDYYYFDFQGYFFRKSRTNWGTNFCFRTQAQNAARHKNGIVVDCARGDYAETQTVSGRRLSVTLPQRGLEVASNPIAVGVEEDFMTA